MKRVLTALAVGLALAVAAFAVFNGYFYPAMGMRGFAKEQYPQAWEHVARGFCSSSSLEYERTAMLKYHEVRSGSEAYCWGVASCRTPQGGERRAWIYLEWSSRRGLWLRNNLLVLADDDDEIYYSPTFPGQFVRAWTAIRKLMRENARHVREALAAR